MKKEYSVSLYHWSIKLLAFVLALCSGAVLALSGFSAIYNLNTGLYGEVDPDQYLAQESMGDLHDRMQWVAGSLLQEYVLQANTREDTVERDLWQVYFGGITQEDTIRDYGPDSFAYSIRTASGEALAEGIDADEPEYVTSLVYEIEPQLGTIVDLGLSIKEFPDWDTYQNEYIAEEYEWTDCYHNALPDVNSQTWYYELVTTNDHTYRVEFYEYTGRYYQVEIYLTAQQKDDLLEQANNSLLTKTTYAFREKDVIVAIVSALVLAVCTVYLCVASGRTPREKGVHLRFANRLPLDLYLWAAGLGVGLLLNLGLEAIRSMTNTDVISHFRILVVLYGLCATGCVLLVDSFLMALCAQLRLGGWQWLRRSVVGRICLWLWDCFGKLWRRIFGGEAPDGQQIRGLVSRPVCWLRGCWETLPLIWQWLLAYGGAVLLLVIGTVVFWRYSGMVLLLATLVGALVVLYTAYGFGKLRDAAKRMGGGDLDTKIDTREEYLYGNFAEFAGDLNTLGDTCVEAAMAKMKSERMKADLITNVSHDIKTPLTSIINYVDLLQRTDNEDERQEYLQVLARQSLRLKKLIEDLMEMSRASSGNVTVERMDTDVVEAVNQALGEFADRLSGQDLQVIFPQSDRSLIAKCDGRLLWRVLSNLLSNVVKYALPGTRVYVDVEEAAGKLRLSLKNISREPLNITADELMERFVRGDASRSSDGNGLGLNIARSLMQAQGGDLELTVDGDLFKVILTLG